MPIRFRCQDCRSRVKVPEGTQGKQVKCPRCGRIQSVPNRNHDSDHASLHTPDLTVHTLVGSIHKAPKRKESLVTPGVSNDRFDAYDRDDSGGSGDSGGGVPGGLNIPTQAANDDHDSTVGHPGDSGQHTYRGNGQMSRKKRRRLQAQAARAQRKALQDKQAQIADSRKRVQDIFATSNHDTPQTASHLEDESQLDTRIVSTTPGRPQPIALDGSDSLDEPTTSPPEPEHASDTTHDHQEEDAALESPDAHHQHEQAHTTRWSLDLTAEAYPFLKLVPWVLRIAALMLIGPAFKAMLVANDLGLSAVVSMLVLFAGLTLVAVTWTVGEIATAVRDIAVKKVPG
jgi:DNA-directed RNA polymerase subunit M/transcription elongation factor TFIIS